MDAPLAFRPVTTFDEYAQCADLQRLIWGEQDVVPATVFAFQREISGLVLGAWRLAPSGGPHLVACSLSFPGRFEGHWVQWSHITAVHPDHRDCGIGHRIKAVQRTAVRNLGFSRIMWSFDPLESRNARLNFGKLGGTSRFYEIDFYGRVEATLLQGLPTDRLLVHWDLERDPVPQEGVAESPPPADACILQRDAGTAEDPCLARPAAPRLDLGAEVLWLEIPPDLQRLKAHDMDGATAWRQATRAAFRHYLGERGYTVDGFQRVAGPRSFYRLVRER